MNMSNQNTVVTNKISDSDASVATREQVSRWLDGDIEAHEVELAMATLCKEEGRYIWAEMHFVGDCIRGLEDTPIACAERICQAIATEPIVVAPVAKRARQYQERSVFQAMNPFNHGAWATAAAVAAVGFVGAFVYKDQTAVSPSITIVQSSAPIITGPGATLSRSPIAPESVTPVAVNADFNAYLQAHEETVDAQSLSAIRQYLRPAAAVLSQQ